MPTALGPGALAASLRGGQFAAPPRLSEAGVQGLHTLRQSGCCRSLGVAAPPSQQARRLAPASQPPVPTPCSTGFTDSDEFVLLQPGVPSLPALLDRHSEYGGVALRWKTYGGAPHVLRPPGGVLASYTACVGEQYVYDAQVKSFVQPAYTRRATVRGGGACWGGWQGGARAAACRAALSAVGCCCLPAGGRLLLGRPASRLLVPPAGLPPHARRACTTFGTSLAITLWTPS